MNLTGGITVERMYRLLFLGLFVVGFLGAVASADRTGNEVSAQSSVISLIKDVRLAQEVNAINSGRWTEDKNELNAESLSHVEKLFKSEETFKTVLK